MRWSWVDLAQVQAANCSQVSFTTFETQLNEQLQFLHKVLAKDVKKAPMMLAKICSTL